MINYNNTFYEVNDGIVFNKIDERILVYKNKFYELKGDNLEIFKLLISRGKFNLEDRFKRKFLILYKIGLIKECTYGIKELIISKDTNIFKYENKFYIVNFKYGNINELSENDYKKLKAKDLSLSESSITDLLIKNYLQYKTNKESINNNEIKDKRVYIIFSYNCNMRCVYCFESHVNKNHISQDTFNKILNLVKDIDSRYNQTIVLYGGEPLLDENYNCIQALFNNELKRTKFDIITNGTNIDRYKELFLEFREKINDFIITLDGTEDIHNKRRRFGSNSFTIIIKNIETLIKNNFTVKIRINLDDKNISCQADLIKYLNEIFRENTQKLVIEYHRVEEKKNPLYESISFKKLYELANNNKSSNILVLYNDEIINRFINPSFYCKNEYYSNNYCDYYNNIVIDYNGDIYHCNEAMGNKDMMTENIDKFKVDSTYEDKTEGLEEKCKYCNYFVICKGNCFMENKIKKDSINNPVCRKKQYDDLINFIIEKNNIKYIGKI
ncbi:radical SAM/SPASM domain-containing protein [Clostridium felsineum]|uniref:GTP 3',8-cyclase n=1 Tax=Clostridium felsineum TaxID=36839 RepID=A0A1S8LZP6_9CLOT|nr:radical SAM protein [Clostridium felsineum]URZ09161.1 GTP 3',8-cyclase [Clostridium felsineum]URZ13847.1 GTP 3',8-cyclase [Clostridium felsineum]